MNVYMKTYMYRTYWVVQCLLALSFALFLFCWVFLPVFFFMLVKCQSLMNSYSKPSHFDYIKLNNHYWLIKERNILPQGVDTMSWTPI